MDMILSKLLKIVKDKEVWHTVVHGVTKSQAWLRLLTDPEKKSPPFFAFTIKNKKPMKAKKSYKDLIFAMIMVVLLIVEKN